jgi:hypothetical protein
VGPPWEVRWPRFRWEIFSKSLDLYSIDLRDTWVHIHPLYFLLYTISSPILTNTFHFSSPFLFFLFLFPLFPFRLFPFPISLPTQLLSARSSISSPLAYLIESFQLSPSARQGGKGWKPSLYSPSLVVLSLLTFSLFLYTSSDAEPNVGPWSCRGRDEELLRQQLWREELQRRQIQCRKALSPAPPPESAHPTLHGLAAATTACSHAVQPRWTAPHRVKVGAVVRWHEVRVDLTRGRNTRGVGGSDAATRVVGKPTVGNKKYYDFGRITLQIAIYTGLPSYSLLKYMTGVPVTHTF